MAGIVIACGPIETRGLSDGTPSKKKLHNIIPKPKFLTRPRRKEVNCAFMHPSSVLTQSNTIDSIHRTTQNMWTLEIWWIKADPLILSKVAKIRHKSIWVISLAGIYVPNFSFPQHNIGLCTHRLSILRYCEIWGSPPLHGGTIQSGSICPPLLYEVADHIT